MHSGNGNKNTSARVRAISDSTDKRTDVKHTKGKGVLGEKCGNVEARRNPFRAGSSDTHPMRPMREQGPANNNMRTRGHARNPTTCNAGIHDKTRVEEPHEDTKAF